MSTDSTETDNMTLTGILTYVAQERKAIKQARQELVSDASQFARAIRGAYQFANPSEPGAGQQQRDAVLRDTQAVDTALQTIDLHMSNIAAKARMAATAVADAEARRKHAAASYRV